MLSSLRSRCARWCLAVGVLLTACGDSPRDARAAADSSEAERQAAHVQEVVAAGGVVDSIVPVAEALRRFRESTPPVDTLAGASPSITALVARLARSVGTRDSADLTQLVLSRAEFAWLYYESSPLSRPPYEAPPGLLFGQLSAASENGARDLLTRFGGTTVRVRGLTCEAPEIEGANRLHKRCTVEFSAPGREPLRGNLFGTVIERDGRFKLLSYANRI